jgi:urea transport system permease protein
MRTSRLGPSLSLIIWILLALVPLFLSDWSYSQIAQYMSYGLFAMSLGFIWGQGGVLSFGQAIFFGIGAYGMALVTLGRLPFLGQSQLMGLAVAIGLAALAANVLGRFLFHGRGLSGAFFAIVTLCAGFVVEIGAKHWHFIGGFNGLMGIPSLKAPWRSGADAYLNPLENYYAIYLVALAAYILLLAIERSPFGTVFRSIRDNEERTGFFGYNVTAYKIVAFTISGGLSGLAGALFVVQFGFTSPALIGFALSTEVLIWVAVGGRGVLLAAFLGAMLVRTGEGVLSENLGNYWVLILGILFVLTVVAMPRGLFGALLALPLPRRLVKRH